MRAASRRQGNHASRRPDQRVGFPDIAQLNTDITADLTDRVRIHVHELWPSKTAHFLAIYGDVTLRQAERILAGRQKLSLSVLGALLGSKYASHFHWMLMESYGAHDYWSGLRHQMKVARLREQNRAIEQELKELGA